MNQPAYAWLRNTEPEPAAVSDDPFSDIPMAGEAGQTGLKSTATNDPFADIPIQPKAPQYEDSVSGSLSKYWDQIKAGSAELASNYYGDQARKDAELYKELDKPGVPNIIKPGVLGVAIVPEHQKEQRKKQARVRLEESLSKAKNYRNYAQNKPVPASVQKFMSGESSEGMWDDFMEDPVEIVLALSARSAAPSLVSMGTGIAAGIAAGPAGLFAGSAIGSGRMEYISSIMQGLDEKGIDWTDPDKFMKAVNDDKLMEDIKENALKRSIAVGSFDGAASLLGGKLLAPKGMVAKSPVKSQLINLPAQSATQGLLGGAGEATGQYWTKGEINPREVAAEALAELAFAPAEAAGTYYSITKGSKGIAQDRLKATNELIDSLLKKRQKAYKSGNTDTMRQVSEELNPYFKLREDLTKQIRETENETLSRSVSAMDKQINILTDKLNKTEAKPERDQIVNNLVELHKRKAMAVSYMNRPHTMDLGPAVKLPSQAEALTEVKLSREQYKQQLKEREEALYNRKQMNPLAAASEAEQQAAAEGRDALEQALAASNAYSYARTDNEIADQVASEEAEALRREQAVIGLLNPQQPSEPLENASGQGAVNQKNQVIVTLPNGMKLKTTQEVADRYLAEAEKQSDYDKALAQQQQAETQAKEQQQRTSDDEIAQWEESQGIPQEDAIDNAARLRASQQGLLDVSKTETTTAVDNSYQGKVQATSGMPVEAGLSEQALTLLNQNIESGVVTQQRVPHVKTVADAIDKVMLNNSDGPTSVEALNGALQLERFGGINAVHAKESNTQQQLEAVRAYLGLPEPPKRAKPEKKVEATVKQATPKPEPTPTPSPEVKSKPEVVITPEQPAQKQELVKKPAKYEYAPRSINKMYLKGEPVEDTGWRIKDTLNTVVLIHSDRKQYKAFPMEEGVRNKTRAKAREKAEAWAKQNPVIEEQQSIEQKHAQLNKEAKSFEKRLQKIGKEWIKDQQHRHYFSDIIKELADLRITRDEYGHFLKASLHGQPVSIKDAYKMVPGPDAKLWYDAKTDFYGSENLDERVYEAAVERLEALRLATLAEQAEQEAKANAENSKSVNTESRPQPETTVSPRAERQQRRKRKLIAIDDELSQAADELADVFRKEAGKLGSGLDPEVAAKVLQHGMKVGVLFVKKGAIKFADWADNVLAVMVDKGISERQVAPYLKSLYQAVSVSETLDESLADQMDSRKDIRAFDVESLLEPLPEYTAKQIKEAENKVVQQVLKPDKSNDIDSFIKTVLGNYNDQTAILAAKEMAKKASLKLRKEGIEHYKTFVQAGDIDAVVNTIMSFRKNLQDQVKPSSFEIDYRKPNKKKILDDESGYYATAIIDNPLFPTTAINQNRFQRIHDYPESTEQKAKESLTVAYQQELFNWLSDRQRLPAKEYPNEIERLFNLMMDRQPSNNDQITEKPKTTKATTQNPKRQNKLTSNSLETDYGADLNGYNEKNAEAKKQFIADAKRTLTRLGNQLKWDSGYKNKSGVSVNEAGVAVSGDVYGKWFVPGTNYGVEVNIGANHHIPGTKTHPQAVTVMWRTYERKGKSGTSGNNQWESFDIPLDQLADKIRNSVNTESSNKSGTLPETKQETTTHENAQRPGHRTLAGESTDQVSDLSEGGPLGEGSTDSTGQGRGYDQRSDRRGDRDELGGGETESVLGADLHSAGAVSDRETGSGGRGALQDNIRLGEGREGGVNTGAADYTITDQDNLEATTFKDKQKYKDNMAAIRLLKELGDRPATQKEQAILAKYIGWGGIKQAFFREDGTTRKGWEKEAAELKELLTPEEYAAARASVKNAHYTIPSVVSAIYNGLENIGFTHGRILEPSMGTGNFFGLMPRETRTASNLVGIELDPITSGIADKLYGGSARIHQSTAFQDFDLADGTYDLVVGNPPFGDETITDLKRQDISGQRIHNYFFAKGMKALRPGGVMAMVVSKGFMDSSKNQKGREAMFKQARLLGAYRLPNEAFKANANADVTTDIIFLQKREEPLSGMPANEPDYRNTAEFVGADGNTMKINQYFVENSDNLLGDMIMNTGRFGPDLEPAMTQRVGFDWKKELTQRVSQLNGDKKNKAYHAEKNVEVSAIGNRADHSRDIENAEINGLYLNDQGELYRRLPDVEGERQGEPITGYTNNQGKEIAYKKGDLNKLREAVKLARITRDLINKQVTDITDPELEPLRQELNQAYDAFVKKYKMLNRPFNKRLMNNADLTIAPMLMALENGYKKEKRLAGKTISKEKSTKADIFTRRTQEPFSPVTKVSSPEEALIVSLAQTGRVDMERMAELYGKSGTEIAAALTGQIYDDPQQGWVTKDEYLSGNVKLKLRQAKEAGRGYENNVKALEAVQPADVSAEDIIVTLGANWQTPDIINSFFEHLGGTDPKSSFIPTRNYWSFKGIDGSKAKSWGTEEMPMNKIYYALLNNKPIAVYKTVNEKRVLDVRATDAANAKAQEIQNEFQTWLWRDKQRRDAMVRRYNDLINTTVNRQFDGSFLSFPGKISDKIIKLRETQVNAIWRVLQSATTLLDHVVGAGKTFTMIAAAMELKRTGLAKKPLIVVPNHLVPQWAEDFARLYPNARVLAARKEDFNTHKRREMLARIATGDWDAVIMAHTSFGKMPTDHAEETAFIKEQLKDLNKAIETLRDVEGKKTRSVADAEKARTKLQEKLKKLLENTGKDVGMTWNETGVDALFVDEAHEFKNLQFYTGMNRVKNINPNGSQKAQDLFIKIRSMLKRTNGRNLIFATGTPISNSMAELFTMQRYLGYDGLKDSGLNHFDAWARVFGMTHTQQERKSSGKFGPVSRFSKFINLPELMKMYRQFADKISNEDIKAALAKEGKGVHIPSIKGGRPQPVVAPRSLFQEAYMGLIEHRFANMPDDPRKDNPLKATNDARKAGLDMRMIYPDLPDTSDSKINQAVDNLIRVYHQWQEDKGTQLLFCDLSTPKSSQAKEIAEFRKSVAEAAADDDSRRKKQINNMTVEELYEYLSDMAEDGNKKAVSRFDKVGPDDIAGWSSTFDAYNDIKQKLILKGIPESEIAFIHEANTDLQKEELFSKVNSGEIRFLLGSTAKMGAGTNVQERLVALHHLDAPWRPSDLEQREGRIIRQGNKLFKRDTQGFEVEILRYATEQTYDVNMWQTLEVKARFIEQVRNGDTSTREANDVAGESATAAEMKAASSGDPRIMEQVEITARLKVLDNLRQTHIRDRSRAAIELERLKDLKQNLPGIIAAYEKDQARVLPIPAKGPALKKLDGTGFEKSKDAEDWLKRQIVRQSNDKNSPLWEGETIGSYRGFDIHGELYHSSMLVGDRMVEVPGIRLYLAGERNYEIFSKPLEAVAWSGLWTRFNNAIKGVGEEMESRKDYLSRIDSEISATAKRMDAPFKYEQEYKEKTDRNQELIEELGSEDKVNEAGANLPEYQALMDVVNDFENRDSDSTAKWLGHMAMANRAFKLASMIKYSKEGKEQAMADKAIKQAKEQGITITDKDLQRARETLAERELETVKPEETPTQQAPKTIPSQPEATTELTTADDAVDYALSKKGTLTADNGDIRIERTSEGKWQISVNTDSSNSSFTDDHVIFDDTLLKLTGGGEFKTVGDKLIKSFPENRLSPVVRRLFGKMGLEKELVKSASLSEPVVLSSAPDNNIKKPLSVDEVKQTLDMFLDQLAIDTDQYVNIAVVQNEEEIYGKGKVDPFYGAVVSSDGSERPVILLIADMHDTRAKVTKTITHELIGHFGLAKFLTEAERQELLNKVKKSKISLKPAWDYVKRVYSDKPIDEQAEEVVTYIAENPEWHNSRWQQILNYIITKLKKIGFFKESISKQEIEKTLQDIAIAMSEGKEGNLFYSIGFGDKKRYFGPGIKTHQEHRTRPKQLSEPINYRKTDNSSSFTAKQGKNQSKKFFNTQGMAETGVIKRFARTASSMMVTVRKGMLPSMGLRQIVDTYRSVFDPMAAETWEMMGISKGNPLTNYQGYVQGMQALKSNKLKDADDIDIEWGQLARNNKADYESLANIMHRATLYEVFPDQEHFNPHEDLQRLANEIRGAQTPEEQAALKKRFMFEKERMAEHEKLKAQYNALGKAARKIYKKVEGYHDTMWQDHQKALEDKIIRSMQSSDEATVFLRDLKKRFHEAKIRGPYFPLQRFGNFYVIAEDSNGQYYREHFETEAQLHKEREQLQKDGMSILSYGLMPDFTSRKLEGVSEFADQLHVSLEGDKFEHIAPVIKDEIRQEINQLALQLLPDVSAAKSMIRRRKVKGFSDNARRSFAFNAIHQSNRLARTRYGDLMAGELERIHDDIDAKNQEPWIDMENRTIAAQVLSELEKQHETIMNPKGSPLAARITNAAFLWYLGASAGAGLVNMTQTPLIGVPLMGARFGYRKTTMALIKAATDFTRHGYNKISLRESVFTLSKSEEGKGVSADEKSMLEQLIDDGTIDTTQTTTLAQIADTDLSAQAQTQQDAWVKINRLVGFFFHNAETANREVTALATYRMAREEGASHNKATEQARKMVFDTHFDYSGANRPRVMKNDWMKVFTIFKQYSQNMTYTLLTHLINSRPFSKLSKQEKKQARKAIAGILFGHAVVAGTLGLPLISWIGPALAAAFGDDDDEYKDWDTLYRNWLYDLFGKQAGHAIAKGVFNGFTGVDLHSRVSINDLWIRSPNWEMTAREENMHYLVQALGPAFGAVLNVMVGAEQVADGDWKGVEKMVPKFVRDGIRTYRYSTEGATVGRDNYQAVIEEFTPWETTMQALGLSPARLGEAYQARTAVKNIQQRTMTARQELVRAYAKAIREGDYSTSNDVLSQINAFNARYPAFMITPQGLRQSMRMRQRYEQESQGGIYLPQAQQGLLNEARFAY